MTYKIATVVVLCTLAFAFGDDKFINTTKPCHPKVYEKLDSCCAMPRMLPIAAFKDCFASQRPEGFPEGQSRSKRDASGETGTVIKRRPYGPRGGPMCLIECVFANQTLLNENKEVVLQAIQDKFVAESGENWKGLVKEVCFNCFNEMQKVDFGKTEPPPPGVKVCKPHSAMLLSCIRRQLTLRCPASELKTSVDETCKDKIEALRTCDPFAIPAPRSLLNGRLRGAMKIGAKSFKARKGQFGKTGKKN